MTSLKELGGLGFCWECSGAHGAGWSICPCSEDSEPAGGGTPGVGLLLEFKATGWVSSSA